MSGNSGSAILARAKAAVMPLSQPAAAQLPQPWIALHDPLSGRAYYVNKLTQVRVPRAYPCALAALNCTSPPPPPRDAGLGSS